MQYITLAAIPLLLILLMLDVAAPSIIFLVFACFFELIGLIDTSALLSSFANPTLITLIILLLISVAIERTSFIRKVARGIISDNETLSIAKLITVSAVVSAFINNTAVVSAFLSASSRQNKINPSKLLLPLSYASILGGITTLIGTSTNLIVNLFVVEMGHEPFNMFSFAYVGIPIALVCLPLLLFLSKKLPERAENKISLDKIYLVNTRIEKGNKFIGKSVKKANFLDSDTLCLLEIERNGVLIAPVRGATIILENDILIFSGSVDQISALQKNPNMKILGKSSDDLLSSNLVEAVIANNADIINQSIKSINFRLSFNAGVIGIRRRGKRLQGKLQNISLKAGDNLILAVGDDFYNLNSTDKNFHLLDKKKRVAKLNAKQSRIVTLGFLSIIVGATFQLFSLFNGLICFLGLLLITKCLKPSDLKNRFPFEVLLVIGSSLAISQALINSGAADLIGEGMRIAFSHIGARGTLVGILISTIILTEIITNNAAAAIAVPIAISTANAYHADILPFVMAVAYGASACFILPFGYQTHLMVFSAGNYKIKDFIKTGFPITILYIILASILIPIFFPL